MILNIQNIEEDIENKEFVAGSKDEKMSTIITKHKIILFSTLKVNSLV